MLTISQIAHLTGTSPRMLRHWEAEGLLTPNAVDPVTGYRRYRPTQVGRVHAIAALRSLGFGLTEIGGLLAPGLTTPGLLDALRLHEHRLSEQIATDRASLHQVRDRLRSIEEGLLMTSTTLQLQPLPALRLAGLSAQVSDETEIGHAVRRLDSVLRARVGERPGSAVVRIYDAAPDGGPIEVAIGIEIVGDDVPDGLSVSELPGEPRGASISYDHALESEADAWLTLDTALEPYGLTTTSPYRAVVGDASITLQAPVIACGTAPQR